MGVCNEGMPLRVGVSLHRLLWIVDKRIDGCRYSGRPDAVTIHGVYA